MSGWTVLTVRGRSADHYEYTRADNSDPWDATADIAATMKEDKRVRKWTTWSGHVYAYLNSGRYDWDYAEELLDDYAAMVRDAVVLGANDTTDTGTARYYEKPDAPHKDEYQETQGGDGTYVGEVALAVIGGRHGIVARDPFHNRSGRLDERYLEDGVVRRDE